MMVRVLNSLSLRARIMTIIVAGAILPLALMGAWLAASGARAGRELLRRELESSLGQVTTRVAERWIQRSGELALLANNEPARRLLAGEPLDVEAAGYLDDVVRTLGQSFRNVTYQDDRGQTRWTQRAEPDRTFVGQEPSRPMVGFRDSDALQTRRSVLAEGGDTIGVVEARLLMSAILPADSLQLVAGAALRIRNRDNGETIGGIPSASDGDGVVSVASSLADPALDFQLAASDENYVQPFSDAARIGLLTLVAVALFALILTAFLTRRLTGSLEEMVAAAGAVADGDLDRSVTGRGANEIQRLASAFNTMTESLRRTLRELSRREALAAVGQFAAAISHEVRNALTAVRLDLQRLAERSTSGDDRALIRRMLGNARRLDSIVTGSLRVARTDPATMRSLVLEGVIRASMTAADPVFHESGTTIELLPGSEEGLRVRGDAGALEQMFVNLLINAAQAMSAGGVARLSIERVREQVFVRVEDEGSGIPPEVLARMGEPFLSSRPMGTGLGFAIARQIAGSHGGEVNVVSSGSAGTMVQVTLPLQSESVPNARSDSAGPRPHAAVT